MRVADGGVGHDLGLILKGVADVAVLIALGPYGSVVDLVFIFQVGIPLVAVMLPRNAVFHQNVCDAALFCRGNGERSVGNVVIGVSVSAIAEVARIVVVKKVVMARIALGVYLIRQGAQIFQDGIDAGSI